MSVALRPWFREPMVWLVLAFPAATVIAGFWTLAIAIRAGGSDAVIDTVQRTAQVQHTSLAADQEARRLGLSASLVLNEHMLVVEMAGRQSKLAPLVLTVSHPTDASRDLQFTLMPEDGRWLSRVELDSDVYWQLRLVDGQGRWQLDGALSPGRGFAILTPRFADD